MIETERTDVGMVVTLNRTEKANALTPEMLSDLAAAFVSAQKEAAPSLILTGRGKVFSAGADLDAARAGLATSPLWEEVSGAMVAFQGLSVAALNGTVAGGAFGMVLACDLRIAVPSARFFYPVMSLGFLPQPSDPLRLRALVGPARAKLILMAGQKISAEQALQFGLVDELAAGEALVDRAAELCAAPAAANADHRNAIKAMCTP
ncbi:enoyl-CoA hydratase [Actibacterium mucosum KCTC 23349]|uniref:Enoyl-CoA hydratase n=1 Tax=Actibacterium mucosum KCTC 23349 TaxID=1454373 RepID=A0A037ZM13_9RHOB|nr:enoyl-CoA hydratase/isomerase family protein [Actibacterium mucosum]KAJ57456.1 enoyl-CoA hydratase [Actibacterium mucosum KCTC 23349]